MTLKELSERIYADNLEKGYDTQSKALSRLLIMSEVSEALEAIRKDYISYAMDYRRHKHNYGDDCGFIYDKMIHHSLIDELADIVIRTLDYISRFNLDTGCMNKSFTDVCNDVIQGTQEVISIKDISFEVLCDYILRCMVDGGDDVYWCINIMCIPPVLAKYHNIPFRDLEYIISEKMAYNKQKPKTKTF